VKPRMILIQSSYTASGTCTLPAFACGRQAWIIPLTVVFDVERAIVDNGSNASAKMRRCVMIPPFGRSTTKDSCANGCSRYLPVVDIVFELVMKLKAYICDKVGSKRRTYLLGNAYRHWRV